MAVGMALVTILAAAALTGPYISRLIVDNVIQGGQHELMGPLIGLLVGLVVVKGVCRVTSQVLFETSSQGVLFMMRDKVYRKLLQEDFAFYNKNRTGDLMSRQTGDMDAIRHFVAYVIYTVYENVLYFVLSIVMIFQTNMPLAFCMVLVLPLSALTVLKQQSRVKPAFKRCRDAFSSLNAFVQENISGNRVVKAFAKEDYEMEKFAAENDKYREAELGASEIWKKYVPVFEFLSYLLMIILMLVGGVMVIKGQMTMGGLVAVNGYLWMLTTPLRMAGWWVNDIQRFTTSVEKIYDTYSAEPDVKCPKQAVKRKHLEGNIAFRNVSYSAEDEDILQQIDFEVEKGQTVGIIGTTGSGKSTLINLLCRFYDVTEGAVKVDGVDVRKMSQKDLRSRLGYVPQKSVLFSGTIRSNIAYGCPDAPQEQVEQAAAIAQAEDFIREKPDKYGAPISQGGSNVSGGQKQRLSIARAIAKRPEIFLFDDSFSALDLKTDAALRRALKRATADTTTLIVAQRISTIIHADQILVLERGRVVGQGTHPELMENCEVYRQIAMSQLSEEELAG